MSTATGDSFTTTADDARRHLEGALGDPPRLPAGAGPLAVADAVSYWVVTLFQLLLRLLDAIVLDLQQRWAASEASESDSGSTPSSTLPPATSTAPPPTRSQGATAGSSVQAHLSAPAASGSRQQCAKCHAMGHSAPECLTQDPAAMRKRVAGNRQRKRDSRVGPRPLPPFFSAPAFPAYQQPFPLPFVPQGFDAAFVADAEELRRRRHQSARDRRRHRAAPPPTS